MKKHNLIDGQWLAGSTATPNVNPSNTSDVIDEFAQADRAAGRGGDRRRPQGVSQVVAGERQVRADILDQIGNEILARKEELGTLLSREEGKTQAGRHRRGRARRLHLQVLRGRGDARARRARALGAARDRRRDHARADGRRRHDHAVELPDRDPRVEDRAGAGLRQLRGVQAGRSRARLRLGARRDHLAHRPASGRVQPRHGTRLGGRRRDRDVARRRRDQLHRLGGDRQGRSRAPPSSR